MAEAYRHNVDYLTIGMNDGETRQEASEAIRALINDVRLMLEDDAEVMFGLWLDRACFHDRNNSLRMWCLDQSTNTNANVVYYPQGSSRGENHAENSATSRASGGR